MTWQWWVAIATSYVGIGAVATYLWGYLECNKNCMAENGNGDDYMPAVFVFFLWFLFLPSIIGQAGRSHKESEQERERDLEKERESKKEKERSSYD